MRTWKYDEVRRCWRGLKLRAWLTGGSGTTKWAWSVCASRASGALVIGNARTEHLAKTRAMRAAKRMLKEAKR